MLLQVHRGPVAVPALSTGGRHILNVYVLSSETGGSDEAGPTGR